MQRVSVRTPGHPEADGVCPALELWSRWRHWSVGQCVVADGFAPLPLAFLVACPQLKQSCDM